MGALAGRRSATITSDVTAVPLYAAARPGAVRETQYSVLGVNVGERPIAGLRLAVRCGQGAELLSPAAALQPAAAGVMPRVSATADGLECSVGVLAPGQGLSLSFVLGSQQASDVDFAWSSPAGRLTVVSAGPPAVSLEGRFGRLAGFGLAGLLAMRYAPLLARLLPAGNLARAVTAAGWAVAAGCFGWVGFGLYDLVRDVLRPGRGR